jgi:hypothetical protein
VIDTFLSAAVVKNPIHRLSGEENTPSAADGELVRGELIDRAHHQRAAEKRLAPGAVDKVPAVG